MKVEKVHKELVCPYCGRTAKLMTAKELFGNRALNEAYYYVCSNYPVCDSYVSTRRHTKIPNGILANGDLRNKRIQAHKYFDAIWKNGIMSRSSAYQLLEDFFGLNEGEAHIGLFYEYRCDEVIKLSKAILERNQIAAMS